MTRDDILNLLKTNDKAVARALVVLNQNQTADEQATQSVRYHNGKGFRPCHARMGTSMAKFYERNGYLSEKQIAYWRSTDKNGNMRIGIYVRQLAEAAAEKAAKEGRVNLETARKLLDQEQKEINAALMERIAEKAAFAEMEQRAEYAAYMSECA